APSASAVRSVSWQAGTPMLTATISLTTPASLSRTASSTAISSNGFIDILTPARSTPVPSDLTRAFRLKSRTRLTATNAFIARSSNGVPGGELHRGHVLEEARFEGRHRVLGDGFGRPALRAVHRADHADLAEEVDLVGAHAEDLARHLRGLVAREVDGQRRDLGAFHLLQ